MNVSIGQIHEVTGEAVFDLLRSRRDGLTDEEAALRRLEVGPNRLEPPHRLRWVKPLRQQFTNFFSILLDIAALTCLVAEMIQPGEGMGGLGWALLAVSVLNSLFAFFQVLRAERAMEELRKFLPQIVTVRRGGVDKDLPADQLVPGDVLLLREGNRIAADARLVDTEALLVDNAPLTGESRSLPLTTAACPGRLIDSSNIAFAGCGVLRGSGTGVVFATGHRTEFGKIAALSRDMPRPPSPLARETNRMIRVLTVIAVALGILFFMYGVATGRSLWVNLVFMLGIIVANVPEGLLPTFTLALSMASQRMAKKNVLVKSLETVEALGAVHVICTDKTGTLTKNKLTCTGAVDAIPDETCTNSERLQALLQAALIASDVDSRPVTPSQADTSHSETTPSRWSGDPLNVAVAIRCTELLGMPTEIITQTRRHFPFDVRKRREAGIYANGDEVLFVVKGAWESLRPMISHVESSKNDHPISVTTELLQRADNTVRERSITGQRVIGVAYRRLDTMPDDQAEAASMEESLVLKGFLTFGDPLRDEVPGAVARCHEAGIRVLLITGDHPETAKAIARACGILAADEPSDGRVVLGTDLDSLREVNLIDRLRRGATVFARTTPEQKMKIVSALKHMGHTVAMTGDGVNDAPALKAADVGVAMGASGTDVARESGDIVLLDDNFASIVAAVEEGRAIFSNIQKFITLVLVHNVAEMIPYLLYVIFPIPLALTIVQILFIDLGTDLLPGISLGQELPARETMRRPPRRPNERLLSLPVLATSYYLGTIEAAYALLLFFLVLSNGGWQWGQKLSLNDPLYRSATAITLTTIVLMQAGNVISRRSSSSTGFDKPLSSNRLLLLGVFLQILFAWAVPYFPPLRQFLGTGPVAWHFFALACLGIPLLIAFDLARKKMLFFHIFEKQ